MGGEDGIKCLVGGEDRNPALHRFQEDFVPAACLARVYGDIGAIVLPRPVSIACRPRELYVCLQTFPAYLLEQRAGGGRFLRIHWADELHLKALQGVFPNQQINDAYGPRAANGTVFSPSSGQLSATTGQQHQLY
jgi:hypothetical protein